MDRKLLDYNKDNLSRGFSRETIEKELIKQDWNKEDIDETFNQISLDQQSSETVSLLIKPPKHHNLKTFVVKRKRLFIGFIVIVLLLVIIGIGAFLYIQRENKNQVTDGFESQPSPEQTAEDLPYRKEIEISDFSKTITEMIWSKDSKKAVVLAYTGGETQVYSVGVIDLEKRNYKELYRSENSYVGNLSSDGSRKLFVFFERMFETNKEGLRLLSLDTEKVTTIVEVGKPERMSGIDDKISPDGKLVLYKKNQSEWKIARVDGSEISDMLSQIDSIKSSVEWFPDSSHLLYIKPVVFQDNKDSLFTINKINVFTGQIEEIFEIASPKGADAPSLKIDPNGKKVLYITASKDVVGRHLFVYDLEKRSRLPLPNIEGEHIEKYDWSRDGSSVIAVRQTVLNGNRHIVVFPNLSGDEEKIFPLDDDFIPINRYYPIVDGSLWLSEKDGWLRYLTVDYEQSKENQKSLYKFINVSMKDLLDGEDTQIGRGEVLVYKSKTNKLEFVYPVRWGEIVEESTGTYSCLRFSNLGFGTHIHYTTFSTIQDFLNSIKTRKTEELYENFREQLKSNEFNKQACIFGPLGSLIFMISDYQETSEIDLLQFLNLTDEIQNLSSLDTDEEITVNLEQTASSLSTLFASGLGGPDDSSIEIGNNSDRSLVGLKFSTEEGWDTGGTSYLMTLYTIPKIGEQIVVVKLPFDSTEISSSFSSKFGYDQWEKLKTSIRENLIEEKKVLDDSIRIIE